MTTPCPKKIRGSPQYHRMICSNLIAFTKTKGMPHLFVTLTINEQTDVGLIDYIKKCEEPVDGLDKPVHLQYPFLTTMYSYAKLFRITQNIKSNGINGIAVKDFFIRFEFQKRGTPHVHCLFWMDIKDKRQLLPLISCKIPSISEDEYGNAPVRRFQIHEHSKNYCKKDTGVCRFKYPRPICKHTRFIGNTMVYELERRQNETMVNAYNIDILKMLNSNMDIQIVKYL